MNLESRLSASSAVIKPENIFTLADLNKESVYRPILERKTMHGIPPDQHGGLSAKCVLSIMPDANRNATVNALVGAAFGAAGQRCMALSALVLVGGAQEWLSDMVEQAKQLKVNAGFEEGADLGPVISKHSKERIESLIQSAVDDGATLLLDGRGYKPEKYPNGNFVRD